jgi:hypothetical protein
VIEGSAVIHEFVISGIRAILILLVVALIDRQRFADFFARLRLGMDNFRKVSDDVTEEIRTSVSSGPIKRTSDLWPAILMLCALSAIAALLVTALSILK